MTFESFLNNIPKIKHLPLPGEQAQIKMSPPYRLELMALQKEKAKTAKQSAVMALCYPDANAIAKIVLILRNTYKGVHSAQVGFPGGKHELEDPSLVHTALRETEEEIGIPTTNIKVLKSMTSMYIPPSNFNVHPYLGILEQTPKFVKDDTEVQKIIEVQLADLLNEKSVISTTVPTSYKLNVEVPAFNLNGHIVWGATAMMLSEIKDLLNQIQ